MSKKILIVRLSAVGDALLSTPVARQLKRQHPDWHVTWLVQQKALASVANNPWLDEIKVMPYYNALPMLQVWRELRGQYDVTIDLQCLAKSAFVTWEVGSPVRIGRQNAREYAGYVYNHHTPVSGNYRYVSQHYLEECLEFGVDMDDYIPELHPSSDDQAAAEQLFAEHGLNSGRPVVALIAFTLGHTRVWPMERFAEVGDRLAEEHGAICVIPGAKSDLAAAEDLASRMRHQPVILAGRTSLGQIAALLQRCDLAVGVETGLTHYSFAVGTPLVCLLGDSPIHNGPTGEKAITLSRPCPYRPCRPHQRCRVGKGRPCMMEITVDQVMEAAGNLLEQGSACKNA
jgi:lipopolysaccharide heptosyltransferase II